MGQDLSWVLAVALASFSAHAAAFRQAHPRRILRVEKKRLFGARGWYVMAVPSARLYLFRHFVFFFWAGT